MHAARALSALALVLTLFARVDASISAKGSCTGKRRCGSSCCTERKSSLLPQIRKLPNSVRHILAGAASGAVGVTALAPLEVVRVNMMLKRTSFRTAMASLSAGWYRGNTADVLAASMRVGITMPAFALYKQLLQRGVRAFNGGESGGYERWTVFLAGALAGCTASIACYPLEVARTRIAVACDLRYGVLGCLIPLVQEEGFWAMYAGLSATLAGVIPFNAIKLTCYDQMRKACCKPGDSEEQVSLPLPLVATIGATSGVIAATSCFPLEVVRRRQMMGELAGYRPYGAVAKIVRTEGVQAILAGSGVNCVKVAMGNSLGFVLYEVAKDCFGVDGRLPPWASKPRRQAAAEKKKKRS